MARVAYHLSQQISDFHFAHPEVHFPGRFAPFVGAQGEQSRTSGARVTSDGGVHADVAGADVAGADVHVKLTESPEGWRSQPNRGRRVSKATKPGWILGRPPNGDNEEGRLVGAPDSFCVCTKSLPTPSRGPSGTA